MIDDFEQRFCCGVGFYRQNSPSTVNEESMKAESAYAEIAREWTEAWNSKDLDRILAMYDDSAEMSSSGIQRLGLALSGRLAGKDELRKYWSRALQRLPNLHFQLIDVSASPDSIVVRYRNDRGDTICEYLRLNTANKIVQGSANHLIDL